MSCINSEYNSLLTLFPVAVGEFSAFHKQLYFLHCDLQPAEGAIKPTHQKAVSGSGSTGSWLLKNPQAEGLSPAKSCDPRHLSLHVTV